MTRERQEEVVLIALVVSLAIHVGLMFLVKPQVMTRVVPASSKVAKRGPMRITRTVQRPDPVQIAKVADIAPKKDAPAATGVKSSTMAAAPVVKPVSAAEVPVIEFPEPVAPDKDAATVFDAKLIGVDAVPESVLPMTKVETPVPVASLVQSPDFSIEMPNLDKPDALAAPDVGTAPDSVLLPTKLPVEKTKAATFTPAEEVYAKVDEQIVAAEKSAVRNLVETDAAADLGKFVNLTMSATAVSSGDWRYFRVMMTPRTSLKTVPKDMVLIIDGSGSIGNDRLESCRKEARKILRTATNTGDRFNLVVFRNAFSYAFRNWRECDAQSFAAGDNWLRKQTAHGRTDVFSTISSVLTLPRDPKRPLIALVITDGDANYGVSDTSEILSKFTALNDGLISVYMYGVKASANRELIDVLTHGNRGESFIFSGWRWSAGSGMEGLSERFRDPVLSDIRIVFSANTRAETYPRLLRNLYRGGTLEFVGRVPADTKEIAFSLKGLNGDDAYEGFFKLPFGTASEDSEIEDVWKAERNIDRKLGGR